MVWLDPSAPKAQEPIPQDPFVMPSVSGGMLPPISSYGGPTPTWNKETMELLVNIEIPKEILEKGNNKQLFVWYKQALMQLQFGNYTAADQRKMIADLHYIIFLSQQDGNEQLVFEFQLLFISNMMISKGRSDKPDGVRERTAWISQWTKSIFGDDKPKRPEEASKGGLFNIPFTGGR
ncbi:MAG: hypothetical protein PHC39_04580 [Proteiniphilum sp.]|nr:hypothetical protein [Proteiniphilum sp.]